MNTCHSSLNKSSSLSNCQLNVRAKCTSWPMKLIVLYLIYEYYESDNSLSFSLCLSLISARATTIGFSLSRFLTRKIASLNDAVVKLKLIHFAERVRHTRHVTPVKRDVPSFDLIFSLRADKHLAHRGFRRRGSWKFIALVYRVIVPPQHTQILVYLLSITTLQLDVDFHSMKFLWSIVPAAARRLPRRFVDGIDSSPSLSSPSPVNVIKRANGIAANGRSIIIQLGGTIYRYNPNLSEVDSLHKTGPNFYNKQHQQRRH